MIHVSDNHAATRCWSIVGDGGLYAVAAAAHMTEFSVNGPSPARSATGRFKDGSEPTALGQLVHQVDRLEGHHRRFAIAVMTDGDPTMQYGIDTIQGVAGALLR
ncbi:MAG: hypothetical protein ACYC91_01695 [Solirubrobacteraceae bacterium]